MQTRWLLMITLVGCGRSNGPGPTPKPTAAKQATPCFPDKPWLVATEMHKALETYADSLYVRDDEPPPPPGTYGTCTVERNIVKARDGSTVAELGCGVRVLQPGIRDDLGLEIGARGRDVLDRKPKPVQPLVCMANGPDKVRCHFERAPDSETDESWYVVDGKLGEGPLTGADAVAFFASRTLVELDVSVWCH